MFDNVIGVLFKVFFVFVRQCIVGKEREKGGGALKGEHSHSCTSKPQSIRQMLQLTILIRTEKNLFHQSFERRTTDKQG